ncbi:hypothetical protein P8452_05289 [Trifolium repens]|nr:hypothetical protein P8452_05289 [Trifolium repens]
MVSQRLFVFSCFVTQLLLASGNCPSSINCGFLGEIEFPFTSTQHPNCGMLVIHGCDDYEPQSKKTIQNNKRWFDVLKIEPFTITIRDDQLHDLLLQRSCNILTYNSMFTVNTPLVSSRLENPVTVFGCNSNNTVDLEQYYSVSNSTSICRNENDTLNGVSNSDIKRCSNVDLPIGSKVNHLDPDDLFNFLSGDIAIKIQVSQNCSTCHDLYGGQCRLDNTGQFYCHQGKSKKTHLTVTAATSSAGVLGVLVFLAWPAMSKVVDMMEGSLESLQIPPKPCLSSPPRSPSRSSDYNTHTSQDLYHSGTVHTTECEPLIILGRASGRSPSPEDGETILLSNAKLE